MGCTHTRLKPFQFRVLRTIFDFHPKIEIFDVTGGRGREYFVSSSCKEGGWILKVEKFCYVICERPYVSFTD